MARVLVYYAHPGHRHSRANRALAEVAQQVSGITFCDLYRLYPRFHIDIAAEQEKLLNHDVIVFQFPVFWYSTPSIIKEWQDLVLEHGFAYGRDGTALAGKEMLLAVTTAGSDEAYTQGGYQRHDLRSFLLPLEQTARLCQMRFLPPYALHSALRAPGTPALEAHVAGYRRLLEALRDDRFDRDAAEAQPLLSSHHLPLLQEA